MVNPTISGRIVHHRDQVFMIVFSLERLTIITFFTSFASTAGPFLVDLDIVYFFPRRLIISLSEYFLSRVLWPRAGLPHGVFGPGMPLGVFPSPPPCGWSRGVMAEPLTLGRMPILRFRPALPRLMVECSRLPTWPMVAIHSARTRRISPEGRRT